MQQAEAQRKQVQLPPLGPPTQGRSLPPAAACIAQTRHPLTAALLSHLTLPAYLQALAAAGGRPATCSRSTG